MSAPGTNQTAKQIVWSDELGRIIVAFGATPPTDATAGYLPGAIFIHSDGGTGTGIYVNEGTSSASCDFNAVSATGGVALNGLTATAAEINAAADVSERIVNVTNAATYTVLAANSGKPHIMPDFTSTCTLALP